MFDYANRRMAERLAINYYNRLTDSDDSGNYKVRLNGAHQGGLVTLARLLWACIPATAINVDSTNNQITATDAGGTSTVTLTTGQYNASTLATDIASQLTADATLSGTYTGSFSADTNKITVSINYGTFSIDQSALTSPVRYVAGLTTTASLPSSGTDLEFPNVVAVLPPYIVLEIPELGVHFPIEYNVSIGSYALTTADYANRYEVQVGRSVSLHQLSFIVRDPQGNIMNLQGAPTACEIWVD